MNIVFAASQSVMNNKNQEIAQSQTNYWLWAPLGRATEHQQLMTAITQIKVKQMDLSSSAWWLQY